jgi:hypothetical protein
MEEHLNLGSINENFETSEIFVFQDFNFSNFSLMDLLKLMATKNCKFYLSDESGKLKGTGGIINSNDIVLIKVNSQWDERGGTNTDLVYGIIKAIVDHPDGFNGEIVVADNGQAQYGAAGNGGSLDWDRNNATNKDQSIEDVVQKFKDYKVSTYLWDDITENVVGEFAEGDDEDGYVVNRNVIPETGTIVSYPKFTTKFGTKLSFKYGLYFPINNNYDIDRLKIINVPVLKAHRIFGVTGAVKSYMGVPSDKITRSLGYRAHDSVGKGGMGTLMSQTRVPDLNILDAIYVNARPGEGPRTAYERATMANIIAVSTDPVALDYWGSKHILCKICEGITGNVHGSLDPDNRSPSSFGEWLKLSLDELRAAGYGFTNEQDKINVYLT